MSAIAGVFGLQAPEEVTRMLKRLSHRGSGEAVVHQGPGYTLGSLPMLWRAEGLSLAMDGFLYNARELRGDSGLDSEGDGHVLNHCYRQQGRAMAPCLEGRFCFALWDESAATGLLVRDRVGHKPLYLTRHQGGLWFASELKALLELPGFQARLNREALHHFLSFGHVPAPLTMVEGITRLAPAHRLTWREGRALSPERYWKLDWNCSAASDMSEEELSEGLLEALRNSVRRCLEREPEAGVLLSGGLDSALVAALAAQVSPRPVRTFTLTHPGAQRAAEVARHIGAEHLEMATDTVPPWEELREVVGCLDEPCGSMFVSPRASSQIRQHVSAVLTGHGADHLLGSTTPHRLAAPLATLARTGQAPDGSFDEAMLSSLVEDHDWMWRYKLSIFTDEEKERLYHPFHMEEFQGFSSFNHMKRVFSNLSALHPLNRILEAEFTTHLPDQVLSRMDALTMAHQLEIHTPYLDTAVVEMLAPLPERLKMAGSRGKLALRAAARKLLPPSLVDQLLLKPVEPPTLTGAALPWVRETLAQSELGRHNLFLPNAVERVLSRFPSSDSRVVSQVLALTSFQLWHQLYLEAPVAASRH